MNVVFAFLNGLQVTLDCTVPLVFLSSFHHVFCVPFFISPFFLLVLWLFVVTFLLFAWWFSCSCWAAFLSRSVPFFFVLLGAQDVFFRGLPFRSQTHETTCFIRFSRPSLRNVCFMCIPVCPTSFHWLFQAHFNRGKSSWIGEGGGSGEGAHFPKYVSVTKIGFGEFWSVGFQVFGFGARFVISAGFWGPSAPLPIRSPPI